MAAIPKTIPNFFGGGIAGRSSYLSAQERLNCYAEYKKDGTKRDRDERLAIFNTPGYKLFTSFGSFANRGIYALGNLLYVVNRGTLYSVNAAGTQTALGSLNTISGRVALQDNGLGNQLVIADGTNGYIWNTQTTTFSTIVDANFPNGTNQLAFQDTYILATGPTPQTFALSQPGAAQTWSPALQGVAESGSGSLLTVKSVNSLIVLLGTNFVEFWQDTGALNFPYQRIPGAATNWGLAAVNTATLVNNSLSFLAVTPEGQVSAVQVNGFLLESFSTEELEAVWNSYAVTSDATAFGYRYGGHSFFQINFPTQNVSWLYDYQSKQWSNVQSGVTPARQNSDMAVSWQKKVYVADSTNGNVYQMDSNTFTENGNTIIRELISRHIFSDDRMITIDRLQIDMDTGIGLTSGQGSAPSLMVYISKDGGNTWGPQITVPLGAIGNFQTRAVLQRLGRGRDWTFKLRMSDPCKWAITNATAGIRVHMQ